MQREDFSVVYCGNIVQADLLKCLLEGQGIQAFLDDEFLGKMVPYAAAAGDAGVSKGRTSAKRRIILKWTGATRTGN